MNMAATSRGRGFAINALPNKSITEIRRPGEEGLKQRFNNVSLLPSPTDVKKSFDQSLLRTSNSSPTEILLTPKDEVSVLCDMIGNVTIADTEKSLVPCKQKLKSLCDTSENMGKCLDGLLQFAIKTKWNSHAVALFLNYIADFEVGDSKFRHTLLSKLQLLYNGRNKSYLELDKFLMEATLFCEIYHHVLINGSCIWILAKPLLDYFGMLLDGSSQKEIEIFIEQFPKCYKNLKETNSSELETIVVKIRKQIVCDATTVTVKSMLLEIFELILTDWKSLNQHAKHLYESYSKPIIRICE